jgi:lysophospholipid acyltransferase (LPLAT)-like uncharacterized protein
MDWPAAKTGWSGPWRAIAPSNRPQAAELEAVVARLSAGPAMVVRPARPRGQGPRNYLERGLIWLARHDVVAISPAG